VVADLIHDEAINNNDALDDDSGNSSMNTSKQWIQGAIYKKDKFDFDI
jgi:hypothetical protein